MSVKMITFAGMMKTRKLFGMICLAVMMCISCNRNGKTALSDAASTDSLLQPRYATGYQVKSLDGMRLVDVGDDYSILQGSDDKWEYYGKVIDSDSLRQVTVMLRYYPEHEDAVELLKEWVRGFETNNK